MEVEDIKIQDLRRTLASYMAISGADIPVIGAALNHKSQASTEIYVRLNKKTVLYAMTTATNTMISSS